MCFLHFVLRYLCSASEGLAGRRNENALCARRAAKGIRKTEVFHFTLTHLRGPSVSYGHFELNPEGSANQRSSAANTVPAAQNTTKSAAARPQVVTDDNACRLAYVDFDHLL
jgi:hypothetical protein